MNTLEKTNERFSVPVTRAEFTVMRTAFSVRLPSFLNANFNPLNIDPLLHSLNAAIYFCCFFMSPELSSRITCLMRHGLGIMVSLLFKGILLGV